MGRLILEIDGMSCGHCVQSVRKALEAVPGASVEKVEVGSATVEYDHLRTSPAALDRAVETAGYKVTGTAADQA